MADILNACGKGGVSTSVQRDDVELHREQELSVSSNTSAFPHILRVVPGAPKKLYYKGEVDQPWDHGVIAVVGSRNMTPYGEYVTKWFVSSLVKAGFVISSGLAVGVDGSSHATAVQHGGRTVAVLPSGTSPIVPPQHVDLAGQILKSKGLILSEFPSGTGVKKYLFHRRNRVLAGLSHAVLVVESAERSGSFITAGYAAEFGRLVFVVASPITNPNCEGMRILVERGATLVTHPSQVIQQVDEQLLAWKGTLFQREGSLGIQDEHDITNSQIANSLKLSSAQQQVLEKVRSFGYVYLDVLLQSIGSNADSVLQTLLQLEELGVISLTPSHVCLRSE